MSEDDLYDIEWNVRISSMEVAPPDSNESERAMRLNPQTSLLREYLENCE